MKSITYSGKVDGLIERKAVAVAGGVPVASGVYFTVLNDGSNFIVQKMLLLK